MPLQLHESGSISSSNSTTSHPPSSSNSSSKWEAMEYVGAERSSTPDAYGIDIARSRFPFAIVWTPIPCLTWFLPFVGHMGIADSRGVIYDFAGPYTISVDDFSFGLPTRYLVLNPDRITASGRGSGSSGSSGSSNSSGISGNSNNGSGKLYTKDDTGTSSSLSLQQQQQQQQQQLYAKPGFRSNSAQRTPTQLWDEAVDSGCDVYSGRMHNLCCDNCHSHVANCLNTMKYAGRSDWNMVTLAIWLFFQGKYVTKGRAIATWLPFCIVVAIVLLIKYVF